MAFNSIPGLTARTMIQSRERLLFLKLDDDDTTSELCVRQFILHRN
ncbi:hypothetical protein RBSH_03592 [Rhodopirellula baltica SH28]|uniref:Uncharacterized protein n=1 Tax=Rhodopirellula baltica SH28 TaxID=993517 RepID=K5DE16_RHOBT|nr:hypothetical protein RBSH_03592 [Rhodopirellula baltica SH28]